MSTISHLLTSCVFAKQVWSGLLQLVGMLAQMPQLHDELFEDWWRNASLRVPGQLKKGFDSLVVLGTWVIWKHRNSCVFNGVAPSVLAVLEMVKEEALLWTMAGAKGLSMLQVIGTTVV
jgi:hypothetical protein